MRILVREEAAAGRLVRISGKTGQPNTQAPSYSLPMVLTRLSNSDPSALAGVWGSPLLGLGLLTHHPLFCPQLQQTEAELRKVDEAIALFQKML